MLLFKWLSVTSLVSFATVALDATFLSIISWFVDLSFEREIRGREVPLDVSICTHEIFGEIWFIKLNLCWCCIYVDLMRCGWISKIWSSDSLSVGCLRLVWMKACIFKGTSIFEDGWLQELESLLALGRILPIPFGVKKFPPLQMKRSPLFIEFSGGSL